MFSSFFFEEWKNASSRVPVVMSTTTFPALRVMTRSEAFYFIDFDVPPDVLSLLQDRQRGVRIGKY